MEAQYYTNKLPNAPGTSLQATRQKHEDSPGPRDPVASGASECESDIREQLLLEAAAQQGELDLAEAELEDIQRLRRVVQAKAGTSTGLHKRRRRHVKVLRTKSHEQDGTPPTIKLSTIQEQTEAEHEHEHEPSGPEVIELHSPSPKYRETTDTDTDGESEDEDNNKSDDDDDSTLSRLLSNEELLEQAEILDLILRQAAENARARDENNNPFEYENDDESSTEKLKSLDLHVGKDYKSKSSLSLECPKDSEDLERFESTDTPEGVVIPYKLLELVYARNRSRQVDECTSLGQVVAKGTAFRSSKMQTTILHIHSSILELPGNAHSSTEIGVQVSDSLANVSSRFYKDACIEHGQLVAKENLKM